MWEQAGKTGIPCTKHGRANVAAPFSEGKQYREEEEEEEERERESERERERGRY